MNEKAKLIQLRDDGGVSCCTDHKSEEIIHIQRWLKLGLLVCNTNSQMH